MGSVTLVTPGLIEEQILVVVQTEATGTATGNAVPEFNCSICCILCNNTFTVGTDYTSTVTTLTFEALSDGGTVREFSILINNDNLCEPTETFSLNASVVNGRGTFSAGGNMATGLITDDDGKCA